MFGFCFFERLLQNCLNDPIWEYFCNNFNLYAKIGTKIDFFHIMCYNGNTDGGDYLGREKRILESFD